MFLKLKDIGSDVLPDYQEPFVDVPMAPGLGFGLSAPGGHADS
ncbi:hypothetical protein P4114_31835 [Pseudomonas aeruginosa]|nr:hypothetical protein [Pseudomonas aeruginosa]